MTWIPNTPEDISQMLQVIGVESVEDLFEPIPEAFRIESLDLPAPKSEWAVAKYLGSIGARNRSDLVSFLGGGYYDHFIPAAVDALGSRGEFLTAYTPYQAECAQGTLQSIYEYQSAIARLTGMEVSNASLYDGTTATFEAATMSVRITDRRRILLDGSVGPLTHQVVRTHARHLDLSIESLAVNDDTPLEDVACVVVQNPAFDGSVRDYTDLGRRCRDAGALLVVVFYPISLGLLKTPGEMGADIAVGEGQSLGIPLGFGGPYLGILATRREHMRKMPGRLAAATEDAQGNRGFVLTLQAREQHIRRERATSNICSNQAHCALRALIYLSLLGKHGIEDVAVQCHSKAEYLKRALDFAEIVNDGPTFNEFVVRLPIPAAIAVTRMMDSGILAGLPLAALERGEPEDLLVAVTEKRTREELDRYAECLRQACESG